MPPCAINAPSCQCAGNGMRSPGTCATKTSAFGAVSQRCMPPSPNPPPPPPPPPRGVDRVLAMALLRHVTASVARSCLTRKSQHTTPHRPSGSSRSSHTSRCSCAHHYHQLLRAAGADTSTCHVPISSDCSASTCASLKESRWSRVSLRLHRRTHSNVPS